MLWTWSYREGHLLTQYYPAKQKKRDEATIAQYFSK